ncbi:MAG: CDP-alcohol phosphatidyltransferase family protein [Actinobacteria bacterium]|nr:CDP-alcohol phosphatidyltransferase family protein [Actinomycetota bacterium]
MRQAPVPLPEDRYGPSALLTPANAVTVVRLVLSPALLVLILRDPSSWTAVSMWIALAVTDGVDGHLARRFGTTRSGAFLDPLADKVLVLSAMFALVAAERFWVLPVGLIAARELAMSLYRTRLGRMGLAVPARTLAKVKTTAQEAAVGFALLPLTVDHPWVAVTALWCAVALTLASGAQYLFDGRSAATTLGHRGPAIALAED